MDDSEDERSATPPPLQHRTISLTKKEKQGVAPGAPGADTAVCHVCGESGHCAGFNGALYIDCVTFNCYLCKQPGHTTAVCPWRIKPGQTRSHAASSASSGSCGLLSAAWGRLATLPFAREREMAAYASSAACWAAARRFEGPVAYTATPWRVASAVLRLHTRRISVMSFHPSRTDLLICGDKSGELGLWNIDSRSERSIFAAHRWLITGLCWSVGSPATVTSSSADGSVRIVDIERRQWDSLIDINPGGWTGDESNWRMFYSVSCDYGGVGPILAGDDTGRMWALDPRSDHPVLGCIQAHGKRDKIQCLHHNPHSPHAVLSAGNDWKARIWDVRTLSWSRLAGQFLEPSRGSSGGEGSTAATTAATAASIADMLASDTTPSCASTATTSTAKGDSKKNAAVAVLSHPRVVNSAYWSPVSGTKILTTCIDNRLRVWDNLHGDLAAPSREIVHSHDFGRYLSPFRAVWDPKDTLERIAVCGRYISEPFRFPGGERDVKLHPVDVLDVSASGSTPANPSALVTQLADPLLATISPVNIVHPSRYVIASGSSRSVFLWRPRPPTQPRAGGAEGDDSDADSGRSSESDGGSDGDSSGGEHSIAPSAAAAASSTYRASSSSVRGRATRGKGGGAWGGKRQAGAAEATAPSGAPAASPFVYVPLVLIGASDGAAAGGDADGEGDDDGPFASKKKKKPAAAKTAAPDAGPKMPSRKRKDPPSGAT